MTSLFTSGYMLVPDPPYVFTTTIIIGRHSAIRIMYVLVASCQRYGRNVSVQCNHACARLILVRGVCVLDYSPATHLDRVQNNPFYQYPTKLRFYAYNCIRVFEYNCRGDQRSRLDIFECRDGYILKLSTVYMHAWCTEIRYSTCQY